MSKHKEIINDHGDPHDETTREIMLLEDRIEKLEQKLSTHETDQAQKELWRMHNQLVAKKPEETQLERDRAVQSLEQAIRSINLVARSCPHLVITIQSKE